MDTPILVALLAFSLLASWPRGAFYPGWYAQPILALLASCCLGIVPGLTMALVGVAAMAGNEALVRCLGERGARADEARATPASSTPRKSSPTCWTAMPTTSRCCFPPPR